ncbi:hypothetical protein CAPTEDRAFT_225942 [Capitella teleta]|uniref:Protein prenyltransferase alpha subunit repeat-containing protein 1 n=1 Tax=Capitella teleta TaxID=283909 RepID=R7TJA4_CAPTE|nr:hypothetical protein CAPTEDRAFT_225942 [Capitella teleta]|eukprot:ELT91185.1 hypothetical protein CAPTEDRAFT_225942 [Capitella teleta]
MEELGLKIISNVDSAFLRDSLIGDISLKDIDFTVENHLQWLQETINFNDEILVLLLCKDEYDFLPVLENKTNQNPVVLTEHKLGIEAWAVKVVYLHAYSALMRLRRDPGQSDSKTLISLTRIVLLTVADCTTAWNIRKELVQSSQLAWHIDSKFSALVLTKHHKSSETFSHRKWLLRQRKLNPDEVQQEIAICHQAAEKYPNNYNAWSHRIWLVHNFCSQLKEVLLKELKSSEDFTESHVSDHSGFHYKQQMMQCLSGILPQHEHLQLLQKEKNFTSDLILRYPGHESVWNHRRYVVLQLCKTSDCCDLSSGKKFRLDSPSHLINSEEEFCEQVKTDCIDSWQRTLASKHANWLCKSLT